MRRNVAIATGIAAGLTALALVAAPALAQGGPWPGARSTSDTTCPRTDGSGAVPGMGMGIGPGPGAGTGMGRPNGMHPGLGMADGTTAASGTLTADQKSSLAGMAEEEKLAQDLYAALAAAYPEDVQFGRITRSESRHLAAVRTLLARYEVPDPTAGLAAGTFASSSTQSLYDSLRTSATSAATALAAGATVEKDDIAALDSARVGVTAPDVLQVYSTLRTASQRHLAAFGG